MQMNTSEAIIQIRVPENFKNRKYLEIHKSD